MGLAGSQITTHAVPANNTTQHPSYTNSNNLRCRTVPSTTAAVCVTVCAVSTDGTAETRTLIYLTNIICNFHPPIRRAVGNLLSWLR